MEMQGICRSGVLIALFSALLGPTAATAQQSAGPEDGKQVIIETYAPSFEAGRPALARRVRRVTTVTNDGSQTVEETEERNPASPSEPLRVIRRSVTTVRRTGAESYVSERQVFELDVNGRLVPVLSQTERTSSK
jgi:hypothetical protein